MSDNGATPEATAKQCLTLVGTASIQDYLFRSNRLKENLGGSYLVAKAIGAFAQSAGEKLIYCGGGNAAVIFPNLQSARDAVYSWSKDWLSRAPGLRLVAAHQEFDPGKLRKAYGDALRSLFLNENAPPFGAPLGALPVVRTCAATGLAAEEEYTDPTTELNSWLSGEAAAKRRAAEDARKDFEAKYENARKVGRRFKDVPTDFDNLGQQEGAAQIAVVHIDGNGIGKLFTALIEEADTDDASFVENLKDLSGKITNLANTAFTQALTELSTLLDTEKRELEKLGIYLKGKYYPVRPIVDGGDDLTFVCQGKLGIPLAVRYLQIFEQMSQRIVGQRLSACAGVAIVHQSFPFSHAYQLAEELTASAKGRRKKMETGGTESGSWIDFEVVREGTLGSLRKLRKDLQGTLPENTKQTYNLQCRPYRIDGDPKFPYSRAAFRSLWRQVGSPQSSWPRSLAKQMLEMMAETPQLPESLFTEAAKRGHQISREYHREGWKAPDLNGVTLFPLYDPLDLVDLYADILYAEPDLTPSPKETETCPSGN